MGILTTGEILLGNATTKGASYAGIRVYKSGSTYRLAGYNSGVLQAYLDSDGKLKAGAGAVRLDTDGIVIQQGQGNANKPSWEYTGGYQVAELNTWVDSVAYDNILHVHAAYLGSYTSKVDICASGVSSSSHIYVTPTIIEIIPTSSLQIASDVYVGDTSASNWADIRVAGGLSVGSTTTAPATGYIIATGEIRQGTTDYGGYEIQTGGQIYANDYIIAMGGVHVGGTADPGTDQLLVDGLTRLGVKVTIGQTTQQVGWCDVKTSDGSTVNGWAFIARSADINHYFTNSTYFPGSGQEWFWVRKLYASYGGAYVAGACELGGTTGLWTDALVYNGAGLDGSTGSASTAATVMRGGAYSGSNGNAANFGSGLNLMAWRNWNTTVMLLKTGGTLYLDGTVNGSAWDEHDDVSLIETARHAVNPKVQLAESTRQLFEQNRQILEETGVVAFNDDGHHFINVQGWTYLLADAIRQMARRLELHEKELVRLGGDSQRLALTAR